MVEQVLLKPYYVFMFIGDGPVMGFLVLVTLFVLHYAVNS